MPTAFIKGSFHRHGDLQEPHEQTAAAPECHNIPEDVQMHQATRPVTQAQTSGNRGWPQHSHKMLRQHMRAS